MATKKLSDLPAAAPILGTETVFGLQSGFSVQIPYGSFKNITTTGNVGIGVTPNGWGTDRKPLQIGSGGSINGSIGVPAFVEVGNNFYNNSSGIDTYITTAAAANYRQVGNIHTWNIAPSGTAGNPITFTPAMILDASGNVTLQKNISVGGAAPTTSGTGITFPAVPNLSSNANTLDTYEQGTWTPVLTFVTNGTMTYTASTASGVYTKIGNVVTCRVILVLSAFTAGTASGQARISLPFTSAQNYFTAKVYVANFTTTFPTLVLSAGAVSYVNVYGNTAINTAPVGIAPANFSATSSIFFSITYTV